MISSKAYVLRCVQTNQLLIVRPVAFLFLFFLLLSFLECKAFTVRPAQQNVPAIFINVNYL